jgi:hypothetical protein
MTDLFNRLAKTLAQPGDAFQPRVLRLLHKSRRGHARRPFPFLHRSMLAAHRSAIMPARPVGLAREIRGARSSNHYDIDRSVKTVQHAIHCSFSGAGLAGGDDGMDGHI